MIPIQNKAEIKKDKKLSIVIVLCVLTSLTRQLNLRKHQDLLEVLKGSNNPNDGKSWVNMFDPWYRDPVNHSSGFCFPQNVKVIVKGKGVLSIKDLKINDEILTRQTDPLKSNQVYTRVTGWLHRVHNKTTRYLNVTIGQSQSDALLVSQHHNIGIQNGSFVFAKDLLRNKLLGKDFKQINQINYVDLKGMYSPMTESNTFIVLTSQNKSKVLAHSYSHIKSPQKYQKIVSLIIYIWESILGKPNYDSQNFQIHPIASILMRTFSFLLQGVYD